MSEKLGGVVPEPFVAGDASHEAIEGTEIVAMGYLANTGSMLPANGDSLSYSPYDGPATLRGTLKGEGQSRNGMPLNFPHPYVYVSDSLCHIENGVMLPHNAYIPFGMSGGPTVDRNTGMVLGMSAVAGLGMLDALHVT